jgi:hypothetical protein
MTTKRDNETSEAISVGDGSLGGPGVGGSINGPDAGVIRDPAGASIAVPVDTEPDPEGAREDPTVEPTALPPDSDARMHDNRAG